MRRVIWAGLIFGALSRVEELVDGFSMGLSSDGAWLAVAFVAGFLAPGSRREAAGRGVAALLAANAGYYLFIALTESRASRTGIADVAGYWFLLGVGGGVVFGLAGAFARDGAERPRAVAWLLLAGALVAEGGSAISRGNPAGAIELALGCLLPLVAVGDRAGRAVGAVCAAVGAVALTGVLVPLVP